MIQKPHLVNFVYSILLVALGLYGFFARYAEAGDYQYTALIPAFFGMGLLALTPGIKVMNKVIAHVAATLTLVLGAFSLVKFLTSIGNIQSLERKEYIFIAVIVLSFAVVAVYFVRFFRMRKVQDNMA